MKILISRTDNIGDVVLTLPLAGWIKKNVPNAFIYFLCKESVKDVVSQCIYVDTIVIWNGFLPEVDVIFNVFPNKAIAEVAKKNKIPIRIGTSHRVFHWFTCNKLVHFSRRKSSLHESQLSFKLLKGLGYDEIPEINMLPSLIGWNTLVKESLYIEKKKLNIILHLKSRVSAKEWQSSNFFELAKNFNNGKFNFILTGTSTERIDVEAEIPDIFSLENTKDSMGKLSLIQLIELIKSADGLIASSTGPLHIAAATGIKCIGLFSRKKPTHAGRWKPIGLQSDYIEEKEKYDDEYLKIEIQQISDKIKLWQ